MKYEHPLYKGYYCTEDGSVFNGDKRLRGTKATVGYWQHYIKGKTILTHRFVYECVHQYLLGSDEIVNHLDHDKLNNHISNLEKTDTRGNLAHYFNEIGRYKIPQTTAVVLNESNSGQNNYASKLTMAQAQELILLSLQGVTNDELASKYGLHPRYISLIRHKKRWKTAWVELGLESSETIPSGSRPASAVEAGCPCEG